MTATRTQDPATTPMFLEPAGSPLPPDTRLRAASSIEWLPASLISQDRRVNTRPVDPGWVAAKSKPEVFNWDFLGTIAVSERADGARISVDGQHRLALLEAIGRPDEEVKCEVFKGLTIAQEAALFIGLNAGRTVRPVSLFLAKVTMGDELSSEVFKIVEDCSWTITATPGRGVLSCVKALVRIHTADIARNAPGGFEPMALRDTLTLITTVWGQHEQAGHESLISGLGKLLVRDGDVIRDDVTSGQPGMDRLIGVLDAFGPDPSGLLLKAKSFQGTRVPQVGLPTAVAQVIGASWSYGKQSRRLAPFVK
jgi:hypothetical protein